MKFSLAIYAAPYATEGSASAYRFACAAIAQGHEIYRLFFYSDGVHNANALAAPPQDEAQLPQQWQVLARENNIDVVVCIASALRRGVLNQEEAQRYDKSAFNLAEGFEISGLGQLVDAAVHSDRVITFGN